jgi:hypothetical protein
MYKRGGIRQQTDRVIRQPIGGRVWRPTDSSAAFPRARKVWILPGLSLGERVAHASVFRRSAAFQDSPSEMPRTSTRRPPADLPQPRRRPVPRRLWPAGREAGRGLSACGPKPPSGDGSVGAGPKPLGLPSEAFAQAGRRAKSTRSMLRAFDFSVAPRLPLSWAAPQYWLRGYAVAGAQVRPGREDDAAMLVAAARRLGRGTSGANSAERWEPQKRTQCRSRTPAQTASVRRERPIPEFPRKRRSEFRSDVAPILAHCGDASVARKRGLSMTTGEETAGTLWPPRSGGLSMTLGEKRCPQHDMALRRDNR